MASAKKSILVTGGNSGIGLALCTLLATEHGCHADISMVLLRHETGHQFDRAMSPRLSAHRLLT